MKGEICMKKRLCIAGGVFAVVAVVAYISMILKVSMEVARMIMPPLGKEKV